MPANSCEWQYRLLTAGSERGGTSRQSCRAALVNLSFSRASCTLVLGGKPIRDTGRRCRELQALLRYTKICLLLLRCPAL